MMWPRRRARVWLPTLWIMAGWTLPIGPAAAAPPLSAGTDRLKFPTYGVAVDSPAGWKRIPEGGPGQVARWVLVDPSTKSVAAFLVIEAIPAGKGNVDAHAKALAQKAGATVLPSRKTLGRQRTLKLVVPGRVVGMKPRHAFVAAHGSAIYVLSLIAVTSDAAEAVLEPVRRSWKWIKTERPEGHLRLMPKPIAIFGKMITMRFPEVARPLGGRRGQKMSLHIYDYVAGRPGMIIEIDRGPKARAMSAEKLMDAWRALMGNRLGLDKPPAVSRRFDAPFRVILDPVTPPLPKEMTPAKGPGPTVRYAMIVANEETVLSVTFFVPPNTKQATQAYY
ncbi:MAG: hypothetical protein ACYS5V_04560, partial [Planctomycetota bacterium]